MENQITQAEAEAMMAEYYSKIEEASLALAKYYSKAGVLSEEMDGCLLIDDGYVDDFAERVATKMEKLENKS